MESGFAPAFDVFIYLYIHERGSESRRWESIIFRVPILSSAGALRERDERRSRGPAREDPLAIYSRATGEYLNSWCFIARRDPEPGTGTWALLTPRERNRYLIEVSR